MSSHIGCSPNHHTGQPSTCGEAQLGNCGLFGPWMADVKVTFCAHSTCMLIVTVNHAVPVLLKVKLFSSISCLGVEDAISKEAFQGTRSPEQLGSAIILPLQAPPCCTVWAVFPDREVNPRACSPQRALHKLSWTLPTGKVSRVLKSPCF